LDNLLFYGYLFNYFLLDDLFYRYLFDYLFDDYLLYRYLFDNFDLSDSLIAATTAKRVSAKIRRIAFLVRKW